MRAIMHIPPRILFLFNIVQLKCPIRLHYKLSINAYMPLVKFIIGRVFAVGIHEVLICVNKIKQWNQKSMIKKAFQTIINKSHFNMSVM